MMHHFEHHPAYRHTSPDPARRHYTHPKATTRRLPNRAEPVLRHREAIYPSIPRLPNHARNRAIKNDRSAPFLTCLPNRAGRSWSR